MMHLGLFLTLALPNTSAAQDWNNLGGNAARNGLTRVEGPRSSVLLWSNTDDFSIIAWQPVVHDQRVFTIRESGFPQDGGAANDALVAYDLHTGVEIWRTTLPWGGDTSVEWIAWIAGARDGRVYASRSSHMQPGPIYAYDAATGAYLWTSQAFTEAFAYDGVVFATDGDLFVGDWMGAWRIEATDGTTRWASPRSCSVSGNCGPAASESGVYIDQPAAGGMVVTKLDPLNGVTLYSSPIMPGFTEQNDPFLSPDGGTVYFSRTQNNPSVDFLYAFEDTGAALIERWHRAVRWTTSHEHGVGPDGSLYTFLQTDEFVRLDPLTGNVTATAGVLAPLGDPSPKTSVGSDGLVYVSNGWASTPATSGRIWAFPADLSQTLFTLTLDRQNQGGPALAQSGTLVVCDRSGVYAWREPFSRYCEALANSTGFPGRLTASGSSASGSGNQLVLTAENVPDQPGIFFHGPRQIQVPFGNSYLCVGSPMVRILPPSFASGGVAVRTIDNGIFVPGQIRDFQYWFRDPMAGGAFFSTTDAASVHFE